MTLRPRVSPRRHRPGTGDRIDAIAPGQVESAQPDLVTIDPAALLREHLGASHFAASSAPVPDRADASPDALDAVGQPWRSRLNEIGQAIGLTGDQESEFERLARSQLDRIRTEIPRLLDALKPHFDTAEEAAAKQRYESGLRALKTQLDEETDALLQRFGFAQEPASPVPVE